MKIPNKSKSATPPPRIGKIGPYTVFMTPNAGPKPESPTPVAHTPVQAPSPPPVMAPPAQFYKERPSSFAFFWDAVARVQNAHASLDEHVAHWFGLNQSKYQWALDDYHESNSKSRELVKNRDGWKNPKAMSCQLQQVPQIQPSKLLWIGS